MTGAWRSALFVPGHDLVKLGKAVRLGADAVIIDLEDGVPPDDKTGTRRQLAAAAASLSAAGLDVIVRINAPWRAAVADLEVAIAQDALDKRHAVVSLRGRMIDAPVARRALRLLRQ